MPLKFPHKFYRFAGLSVALLMVIFIIVGEGFSIHYKRLIRSRLPALSAKATDSLYNITVQDIRINIFTGAVTVYGLRMAVDLNVLQSRRAQGRSPHVVLDVTVPEAHITGVKWNDLTAEKSLSCRTVAFYKPEIRVQILPGLEEQKKAVYHRTPAISSVSAKRISIEEPVLDVRYSYGDEGFSVQTSGGRITASDWDFYPRHPLDTNRFFGATEADISLEGATYAQPGSLYQYTMSGIGFNTRTGIGEINGLRIGPKMSYDDFYARIGYRSDIYECFLPRVSLRDLDWRELLTHHTFFAGQLWLSAPDLSIFYSKKPPPAAIQLSPYPVQWLQRLNMPLTIRSIHVTDGAVRYSETNNKTGETGTLQFEYLRGTMYNVTNRKEAIDSMPLCRALLQGKFMHRTDIAGVIDFALNSQKGAFSINGFVQGLDASQIRVPINALAIADLKSLEIPKASIHIAGNKDSSWGRFSIYYNNLKLKLKKWDAGDSDVHSRVFLSFLANKLLLYPANPMPGEKLRSVTTNVPRGVIRSFFLMVWKNIFQGCTLTAIRDEGALDIVKRKAANKGKPKQPFFKGLFPKRVRFRH